MDSSDLILAIFVAVIAGGMTTLLWTRLGRLEEQIVAVRSEMVPRGEYRHDVETIRHELVSLRSDLTQVALAVGATPRRDQA